jgi:hypothetical protein
MEYGFGSAIISHRMALDFFNAGGDADKRKRKGSRT